MKKRWLWLLVVLVREAGRYVESQAKLGKLQLPDWWVPVQ